MVLEFLPGPKNEWVIEPSDKGPPSPLGETLAGSW